MAQTTLYLVQAFKKRGKRLIPGPQAKMIDEAAACRRAERLAQMTGNVGAVAISITGDAEAEDFEEPVVLARFGETPAEE